MPGHTGSAGPTPPELALRLLLATMLALTLARGFGREATQALLPLIGHTLTWLDDHYRILALTVGSEAADSVIRLRATLSRPLVVGGHLVLPDPRGWAEVTTPMGRLLQPPSILLALALAWPASRWQEWPMRLLLAAPFALTAMLLDTPFIIWAGLWDLHAHVYETGRFSPLLAWARLLDGGGRLLLGLLGGVAVILLTSRTTFGKCRDRMVLA